METDSCTITVLCYVAEHRRQVDFSPKEGQTHLQCLLEAVQTIFSDVVGPDAEFILQLKSEVWKGEFVDIRDADSIPNEAIASSCICEERAI